MSGSISRRDPLVHLLQVGLCIRISQDTGGGGSLTYKGKCFHNGARWTATRQGYLYDKAHFLALCIFMSHPGEVAENRGAVGDLWVRG